MKKALLLVVLLAASPFVLAFGERSSSSLISVALGQVHNSTFDAAWLGGFVYFSWTGESYDYNCTFGVYKLGEDAKYLRNPLFFANSTKEFSFQMDNIATKVPSEGFVIAMRALQYRTYIRKTYIYQSTTSVTESVIANVVLLVLIATWALCVCYCSVCCCFAICALFFKKKKQECTPV